MEYKGLYNLNNPFTVKSEKAHMLNEEPDIIYMTNMHVALHMNDGRIVIITSKNGRYNKVTYDCYFEDEVKARKNEDKVPLILNSILNNLAVLKFESDDLKTDESKEKIRKILTYMKKFTGISCE